MGASIKRIRADWDVQQTKQDKGLTLTLRLTAYDNGMFTLDGVPLNDSAKGYDLEQGWVTVSMVIAETLDEFRKDVRKRRNQ
jgi:hypothetical protein